MSKINHSGIVTAIDGKHLSVKILQSSACASCKIAGHCSASEQKEKMVDVYTPETGNYNVGQSVNVYTDSETGHRAVWIGYGIPLILMVVVLFAVHWATGNDATAALSAIAILIPYYIAIYFLRARIAQKVSFKVEA